MSVYNKECLNIKNMKKIVREYKILTGKSPVKKGRHTTPEEKPVESSFCENIQNNSTPHHSPKSSLNSNVSIISSDITEKQDPTISNMATLEELARQVKELKTQIGNQAKTPAPPAIPLDKGLRGLNFKETRDAMSMFPSKFNNASNQDATDHMTQFELWCEASNNSTDEQKVRWFCFSILGDVTQWFKQTDFFSFEDLKEKFELNFGKYRTTEDARIAFQSITLGSSEKASDYYRRIRNLALSAGMTEADVKDQFFRGLGDKHNCVKQVRNLYTLEQTVTYLQSVIDFSQKDKMVSLDKENVISIKEELRRSRSSLKKPYRKEESYKGKSSQPSSYTSRSTSSNSFRSRSRSQSRGRRPSTSPDSECFNCGGRGHLANVCPTKKGNTIRSKDKLPKSTQKTQRYYSVQEQEPDSSKDTARIAKLSTNTTFKKVLDVFGNSVIIPVPEPKPSLN